MKEINEVYPDSYESEKKKDKKDYYYFDRPYDYQPLLESFGYNIILKVDDDDYQGDSRLLYKDGDRIGLLIFGWGSCSGCDSLQACESMQEISELRDQLFSQIVWKDNTKEMFDYINQKDWKLDYCWHADETKKFVKKALDLLSVNK